MSTLVRWRYISLTFVRLLSIQWQHRGRLQSITNLWVWPSVVTKLSTPPALLWNVSLKPYIKLVYWANCYINTEIEHRRKWRLEVHQKASFIERCTFWWPFYCHMVKLQNIRLLSPVTVQVFNTVFTTRGTHLLWRWSSSEQINVNIFTFCIVSNCFGR